MKLFVTVGLENFPFDRLVELIDLNVEKKLIPPPILSQTGHSAHEPRFCPWKRFLPFDEILAYLEDADIIVCHAGVGTTLIALSRGKIPILFPRQARYNEHVDDHQKEFAYKMVELGKVLAAWEGEELIRQIQNYKALVPALKSRLSLSGLPRLEAHLKSLLYSYEKRKERRA
ncbi:MAG: glycosyltransferase [Clostridiales bacterium]|nr:glycosyltransferase [Clostridiales bacterium]